MTVDLARPSLHDDARPPPNLPADERVLTEAGFLSHHHDLDPPHVDIDQNSVSSLGMTTTVYGQRQPSQIFDLFADFGQPEEEEEKRIRGAQNQVPNNPVMTWTKLNDSRRKRGRRYAYLALGLLAIVGVVVVVVAVLIPVWGPRQSSDDPRPSSPSASRSSPPPFRETPPTQPFPIPPGAPSPPLQGTLQFQPSLTASPTSSPYPKCFTSLEELTQAVDTYLSRLNESDPVTELSTTYGEPLNTWCVGRVTSFYQLFSAARNINATYFNQDISLWNTSSVTDMTAMFASARSFNQNLGSWDVRRVTSMASMFSGAVSFNGQVGTWQVARVVDMSYMFSGAANFSQDLSSWDVSRVQFMAFMFSGATAFNGDISVWSVGNASDMTFMFAYASQFHQNLCSWGLQVHLLPQQTQFMFSDTSCSRQNSPNWTTSPSSPWCDRCDLSHPTSQPTVIGTGDTTVTMSPSERMPTRMPFPSQATFPPVSPPVTTNVSFPVPAPLPAPLPAPVPAPVPAPSTLSPVPRLSSRPSPRPTFPASKTPPCFTTYVELQIAVEKYLANNASYTEVAQKYGWPIGTWCVSQVTTFEQLFQMAADFNEDISEWNTSSALDMSEMFQGATAFNQNLRNWDVSKVTSMAYMFKGATNFNGDIVDWNVGNVQDMSFMFSGAAHFRKDIASWNVSSVTSTTGMFAGAVLFNRNISGWEVSKVADMSLMFSVAVSFRQDLCSWGASVRNPNTSTYQMFSATLCPQYDSPDLSASPSGPWCYVCTA